MITRRSVVQAVEDEMDIIEDRDREADRTGGPWIYLSVHGVADSEKLAILMEEVGEVAKAIAERDDRNIGPELIQVAAVAMQWLTSRYIDQQGKIT